MLAAGQRVSRYQRNFNPAQLSGCTLWLSATRSPVVLREALGLQYVSQWQDLSGNGNHAAQSTAVQQMEYVPTGMNGRPCLRGNGTTTGLVVPDHASYKTPELELFIVCTSNLVGRITIGYASNMTNASPWWRWIFYRLTVAPAISLRIDSNNPLTPTNNLWGAPTIYSYNTVDRFVYRNGSELYWTGTGRTVTYPTPTNLYIGMDMVNGANVDGDYGEIILYNRRLTTDERAKVTAHLSSEWGIATL